MSKRRKRKKKGETPVASNVPGVRVPGVMPGHSKKADIVKTAMRTRKLLETLTAVTAKGSKKTPKGKPVKVKHFLEKGKVMGSKKRKKRMP